MSNGAASPPVPQPHAVGVVGLLDNQTRTCQVYAVPSFKAESGTISDMSADAVFVDVHAGGAAVGAPASWTCTS